MSATQEQLDRLSAVSSEIGQQVDLRSLAGAAYVQAQTTQALLGTLVRELTTNGGLDRGRYDAAVADALRKVADDLKAPGSQQSILLNS